MVPHPGLGPVAEDLYEEETVTHKFYQWVPFTLYFQVNLKPQMIIIFFFVVVRACVFWSPIHFGRDGKRAN